MIMTGLAAALVIAPAAYKFDPGATNTYKVNVQFEGYLPVLGGNEGIVDVKMGVKVEGLSPEGSALRAASELTAFELNFNEVPLPLTLENAVEYFPRTTIQATPFGKILKTDAPNVALPVRLPGLDVKRFPDITYMPLELPESGLEAGKSWTFTKQFDGAPMNYQCVVQSVDGDKGVVSVKVNQKFDTLENEAMEIVTDPAKAVRKVQNTMTGTGTVTFDLKVGAVSGFEMVNNSTGQVEMIKTGLKSERKLKTTIKVNRNGAAAPATKPAPAQPAGNPGLMDRAKQLWTGAVDTGKSLWNRAIGYWTLLKLAIMSGPGMGPLSKGIAKEGTQVPPINFTDWLRKI